MKRNGGYGRIFYKPENGPGKGYNLYWTYTHRIEIHHLSADSKAVIKKRQRKKSRQWGKRDWDYGSGRYPLL